MAGCATAAAARKTQQQQWRHHRSPTTTPRLLSPLLTALPLLLLLASRPAGALKLKVARVECLTYEFKQYEYFYGSYVAQADQYGVPAKYDLAVSAPSGAKLYEVASESEATFHLVPVEAGPHRFCLTFNVERSPARAIVPRDVLWNINIGYSEVCGCLGLLGGFFSCL
jgi:hypothetical protein